MRSGQKYFLTLKLDKRHEQEKRSTTEADERKLIGKATDSRRLMH